MTKEQIKQLNNGGIVPPTVITLPTFPNSFRPQGENVFNEGIPQNPTQKDFNGIPLADVEHLHGTKYMDDLHRTDALSEEYKRGENLKSVHKSVGKDKFKNIYQTLKNKK